MAHSLTHARTHSRTHSRTLSFTPSLTHIVRWVFVSRRLHATTGRPPTHSPIYQPTYSPIYSLTHTLIHLLTHSPTLTSSLPHPLTHSPTHSLPHSHISRDGYLYPAGLTPGQAVHPPTHPLINHSPIHSLTHPPSLTHIERWVFVSGRPHARTGRPPGTHGQASAVVLGQHGAFDGDN